MKRKEAWDIVGGLGTPSKMPCFSYSLSAFDCKMGELISKNKDTICGKCYAKRGNYTYNVVHNAHQNRLKSLSDPRWVNAMALLIKDMRYFRWHDSGDLQGKWHLDMIVQVAKNTPDTKHWLPTREYQFVKGYIENGGVIPNNLIIRLSSSKFDGKLPEALARKLGVQVSGASKSNYNCPASKQNNKCEDCRLCWDSNAFSVTYKRH